jgi:hypothetical protein
MPRQYWNLSEEAKSHQVKSSQLSQKAIIYEWYACKESCKYIFTDNAGLLVFCELTGFTSASSRSEISVVHSCGSR